MAGRQDFDAECVGDAKVAEVVGDDTASGGVVGELDEGFVVWVWQNREPTGGELPFLGAGADGVEQGVHVRKGEAEFRGVALEDFFVFVDEVVAEDGCPAALAEGGEDLERPAEPRTERGIKNVRIHDGANHFNGGFHGRSCECGVGVFLMTGTDVRKLAMCALFAKRVISTTGNVQLAERSGLSHPTPHQ